MIKLLIPLILLATVFASTALADSGVPAITPDMPPPENYDAIMLRQFEALTADDTVAGYQLYIERNPDDALSDLARSRLIWLDAHSGLDIVPPWRIEQR